MASAQPSINPSEVIDAPNTEVKKMGVIGYSISLEMSPKKEMIPN